MKTALRLFFALIPLLTLSLMGCGDSGLTGATEEVEIAPEVLLRGDLEALHSGDSSALIRFDQEHDGIFTRIFGGATYADVRNYLETRIKYYIVPGDSDVSFSPEGVQDVNNKPSNDRATLGASNIGMTAWLTGVVYRIPVTFNYHGQSIPVDSSRVGVMLFGEGYTNLMKKNGRIERYSSKYRQSMLMHEARHSDCTGGITEADLDAARSARTMDEYEKNFKAKSCGHLHVRCPEGHPLSGLLACDSEAWGAYMVGAIYSRAMAETAANEADRQSDYADAIDSFSRVLVSITGTPDMSSQGLR